MVDVRTTVWMSTAEKIVLIDCIESPKRAIESYPRPEQAQPANLKNSSRDFAKGVAGMVSLLIFSVFFRFFRFPPFFFRFPRFFPLSFFPFLLLFLGSDFFRFFPLSSVFFSVFFRFIFRKKKRGDTVRETPFAKRRSSQNKRIYPHPWETKFQTMVRPWFESLFSEFSSQTTLKRQRLY